MDSSQMQADMAPDPVPEDQKGELEQFATLVAEEFNRLEQKIPAAVEQPVAPAPPVINVAASAPDVIVNVPAAEVNPTFAPVINVEAAAPQITVQPAGPVIQNNLTTESVNVGFDIATIVAALVDGSAANAEGYRAVSANISELVARSDNLATATQANADAIMALAEALTRQTDATERAFEMMTSALSAPRTIVTDANGQPTGIRVDRTRMQ